MDKILEDILSIKRRNDFLSYIVNRITNENYRGTHKSQHQRYDLDKAVSFLRNFYNIAATNKMLIPKGDWKMSDEKKQLELKKDFYDYYCLVQKTGIGANSIKKHLFVDFARAGFFEKYDKNGRLIQNLQKRTSTKHIKLSEDGVKLLSSDEIVVRYRLFTKGVEKLLGDSLIDLIQAIDLSEFRRETFTFEEYTLIFSDDENIDGSEKIELLKSYRSLSQSEKRKTLDLIKKYCTPERFKGNKTTKRDYHNWKNETDQLFSLFKTTIYFEVLNQGGQDVFKLNTSDNIGIFTATRGAHPKSEYFKRHGVEKISGYELHHIVPISYVVNKEEHKIVDDYRNLIYLCKQKHNEIKRNYIIFAEENPRIHFKDRCNPNTNIVTAERSINASFNPQLLNKIEKYNQHLIKKLGLC